MLKIGIIFLLFLRLSVSKLVGGCNQCFASNKVACLNEKQFSTCFQGSATPTITTCPDKYVCTDDVRICRPIEQGFKPICTNQYCGECENTNGIFTCIDETSYGYCFGAKTPLESTLRSCPSKYVCNYDYREICVPEELYVASCAAKENSTTPTDSTTEEASISTTNEQTSPTTQMTSFTEGTTTEKITTIPETTLTTQTTTNVSSLTTSTAEVTTTAKITTIAETTLTTETTTKLSPLTTSTTEVATTQSTSAQTETTSKSEMQDANTICGVIRQTGYFKSADNNCRQYVYCYLLSGQYLGWFYYCDFYFNAATQKCQKERPPNCAAY